MRANKDNSERIKRLTRIAYRGAGLSDGGPEAPVARRVAVKPRQALAVALALAVICAAIVVRGLIVAPSSATLPEAPANKTGLTNENGQTRDSETSGNGDSGHGGESAGDKTPAGAKPGENSTGEGSAVEGSAGEGKAEGEAWVLYVTGQVARPGLVRLPPGARLHDAVEQAGGLTSGADRATNNLARPVSDGEHIHITKPGETPPAPNPPATHGGAAEASGAGSQTGNKNGNENTHKISLNRASAQQLQQLPGVGPALSTAIVTHRTEHGKFPTIESLQEVPGIGPKMLKRLKPYLSL